MHKNSGKKENILRNSAFQTIIASLLCIVLGLFVGYIVLLIINPAGAGEAIVAIMKNFLYYPSAAAATKYLGTTLVKASALLMCSLSVLFAYKVGLFNIGAAGQYVVGVGACLYFALRFNMPWYVCLIAAIMTAALVGGISGALKAYSVGINVYTMRYAGVLISGALGGLGGLVYITAGVSEWKFENGVAGFGFLALAVMIFGQWRPVNIGLAALLFGLFRALSNVYTGFDALVALKLPSTIYNMLPYIISLIVLVFVSGKSRAPKAEGIPYDKGQR